MNIENVVKKLSAVAFPDFPICRNLSKKISWVKAAAKIAYIWAKEDGSVEYE